MGDILNDFKVYTQIYIDKKASSNKVLIEALKN